MDCWQEQALGQGLAPALPQSSRCNWLQREPALAQVQGLRSWQHSRWQQGLALVLGLA